MSNGCLFTVVYISVCFRSVSRECLLFRTVADLAKATAIASPVSVDDAEPVDSVNGVAGDGDLAVAIGSSSSIGDDIAAQRWGVA